MATINESYTKTLRKPYLKPKIAEKCKNAYQDKIELVRGRHVVKGEILFYDQSILEKFSDENLLEEKNVSKVADELAGSLTEKINKIRNIIQASLLWHNTAIKIHCYNIPFKSIFFPFILWFFKLRLLYHKKVKKQNSNSKNQVKKSNTSNQDKIEIKGTDLSMCCESGLILVRNERAYQTCIYGARSASLETDLQSILNNQGFSMNDVVYAKDGTEPTELPPDTYVQENLEEEGDGRFYSLADPFIPVSCKDRKPVDHKNPDNDRQEPPKVKLGIIDFGLDDPHGNFIYQIITNSLDPSCKDHISIRDYNIVETNGLASIHNLCCQIQRAIFDKADVLNISMGYYAVSPTPNQILLHYLQKAEKKNILIVTSAGNAKSDNDYKQHWPSNFSLDSSRSNNSSIDSLIGVGSAKKNNTRADFSNYGSKVGCYAKSTYKVDARTFANVIEGTNLMRYNIEGTSYSAGEISARAAELKLNSANSISDIVKKLEQEFPPIS